MSESRVRHRARFVFAEFFVIVVGVLVALGVDQFRADRADDLLEDQYGRRLIADLEADSPNFSWFREVFRIKAEVVEPLLLDPEGFVEFADPVQKMAGLVHSTYTGLPNGSAATFGELQSTGRRGLLEDEEIRGRLGEHHALYSRITEIRDVQFGGYRELVFSSMPGPMQYDARLDSTHVDSVALSEGLRRLVDAPGLEEEANAELAYTGSLSTLSRKGGATHR